MPQSLSASLTSLHTRLIPPGTMARMPRAHMPTLQRERTQFYGKTRQRVSSAAHVSGEPRTDAANPQVEIEIFADSNALPRKIRIKDSDKHAGASLRHGGASISSAWGVTVTSITIELGGGCAPISGQRSSSMCTVKASHSMRKCLPL